MSTSSEVDYKQGTKKEYSNRARILLAISGLGSGSITTI
jgi:hypothetical protein